jgi:hypothetical protein
MGNIAPNGGRRKKITMVVEEKEVEEVKNAQR